MQFDGYAESESDHFEAKNADVTIPNVPYSLCKCIYCSKPTDQLLGLASTISNEAYATLYPVESDVILVSDPDPENRLMPRRVCVTTRRRSHSLTPRAHPPGVTKHLGNVWKLLAACFMRGRGQEELSAHSSTSQVPFDQHHRSPHDALKATDGAYSLASQRLHHPRATRVRFRQSAVYC